MLEDVPVGLLLLDAHCRPLWFNDEVAMRVREGLRTAEIAAELRRSPLTVKIQLASVFSKLGVRGRARVAALLNR